MTTMRRSSLSRLSSRCQKVQPGAENRRRLFFESLEDRRLLAVSAMFAGDTLTVELGAANDHAFIDYASGNIRVGTTNGGSDVYAGSDTIANLVIQDAATNANQQVTFSGGNTITATGGGSLTTVSATGIETANVDQLIDVTTISGNAAAVNVESPGRIQHGIDLAASGATVQVAAGTYNENVNVPPGTNGLNLLGANTGISANPVHMAVRGAESIINGNVQVGVPQGASNIRFDGFTVNSGSSNAVAVRGTGMTVANNILEGSMAFPTSGSASGIRISDSSPVGAGLSFEFENNYISGYRYGLLLDGGASSYDASGVSSIASGNYLTNNERAIQSFGGLHGGMIVHEISDNTITGNDRGIRLAGGQFTISGNVISNNTQFGIEAGVSSIVLADLTIEDNVITGTGSGDGIILLSQVNPGSNVTIRDTTNSGYDNGGSITNVATVNWETTANDDTLTVEGGTSQFSATGARIFDPISFSGVTTLNVATLGGDDTVTVTPHATTVIDLDGGPHPNGDTLIYISDGVNAFNIGSAVITTDTKADINHANFENIDIVGNLVLSGTGDDDTLEITATDVNSGSYVLTSNGVSAPAVAFSGITSLTFDGLEGHDILRINNPGGGFFAPSGGIVFHGGPNSTTSGQNPSGDRLEILGGAATSVEHRFTDASDGFVHFNNSVSPTITYTGLEPVTDSMSAVNRVFSFTWDMVEMITLDASGTLDNRIDSTQGEMVDFTNPSDSLTINVEALGGSGADVINIEGLDAAFDADLTINGGNDDTVNFQTAATNLATGTLLVTGNTINLSQNVSSEGATLTAQNAISLTGTATLDTGTGTVSVLANQDNAGAESFSQDAGTAIVTTNATLSALSIAVAGSGPAQIAALTAGTTTGRVTVTAGGAITDSNGGATNITADDAVLSAGGAIASLVARLQLDVDTVTATAAGDIGLEDVNGDLTVNNVASTAGSVRIDALDGNLNVGTVSAAFNVILEAPLASITDTNGAGTNNVSSVTVEATAANGIDLDITGAIAGGGLVTTGAGDILVRGTSGTFSIAGAGITTFDGDIVAAALGGALQFNTSLNAGGVNTVALSATGDVTMMAGSSVSSGGGVDILAGGNITALDVTAGANTAAGGTAAIKLSTTSGNVNVDGPLDATTAADLNIDIDPVDVNVNADITATGDIDIVADNDVTVAAGVTIEADSDNSGAGDLTIAADADDNVDDGTGGTLLANAVSNLLGADVDLRGDVVTVDNVTGKFNDAAITADVDATLTGSASAADDVLVTALLGNVVIAASASATALDDIELDADGTVTVGGPLLAGEDVEIQTNFSGQGSVFVDAQITADGNVVMLPDDADSDVLIGSGAVITSDADMTGAEDILIFPERDVIQSSGSLVSNTGAIAVLTSTGNVSIISAVSNGLNQITGDLDLFGTAAAANASGDAVIQIWPGGTATVDGIVATAGDVEVVSDFDDVILGSVDAVTNLAFVEATDGAIIDNNGAAVNITADALALAAVDGIGSGDALETDVQTLAASNASSGNIEVDDVGGNANPLIIGTVVDSIPGITNTGGAVSVTNLSPLTVAADVTATGPITLTATDSGAGDDLTVNPGVTVNSTGSNITLNAGDDALIDGNLSAATTVTINGDFGNTDAGLGTTITINGVVTSGGGAFLNGDADDDTFNLAMQTTSSFTIDGLAPSFGMGVPPAVGDTLNLGFGAATDPTLTVDGATPGSGTFTTSSPEQPVTFTDIEQFDTSGPYHLVVDRSAVGLDGDVIDAQVNAPDLELRVNGGLVLSTPQVDILSLTMIGSSNDETFSITETASGLPSFLTTPPSFVPGSNGGHLNPTTSVRLTAALGTPPALTDVTLHIDGGSGDTDDLLITLINGHDVGYTSDTMDSANSGNIGIVSPPFAGPMQNLDLLLSFANLEPITLVGAGGGLLLDASSTPATTNLTISDAGAPGDGVSIVTGDGGFEDTTFSGFDALVVVSGTGAETITLASVDPAPSNGAALGLILIDGDNATGTDAGDDTINVQSLPATIALQLLGGAGDDNVNLFDGGSTVDNIAGSVLLDGEAGSDTLTVIDSGDMSGDAVQITETTIEGMTSFAGTPDIAYLGIEQLDVTTSSDNDDIVIDMTSGGSDLVDAVISAAAGDDQLRLESFITGLSTITINGNAGSDTFNDPTGPPNPNPNTDPRGKLEPSLTTTIFVNGEAGPTGSGNPTSPPNGDTDTFNLDVTVLTAPVIVDTIAGIATSAGPHQNVHFSGMEDLCLDDTTRDDVNINIGELYVRTTDDRERITFTSWNDGGVKLRIDNLDLGTSTTFPEHFGLAGGLQMLERIVTFAQDGNDLVSIAGHVVDAGLNPIPVEFHGEDGDDYLTGANADDILVGGPGNDRVLGGEGNNQLFGDGNVLDQDGIPIELDTDGNDNVSGRSGNDIIFGGGGNDQLNGSSGDDVLNAGSGNDLLDGGLGTDILRGGDGNDNLSGSYGDDVLLGGAGDDSLFGRQDNDLLIGGTGADQIRGDAGNDLLVAGATDQDDANDAALLALLAAWSGSGTNNLTGITGDGDRDDLQGATGDDEFWAEILPEPPLDYVRDAAIGESVNNEA